MIKFRPHHFMCSLGFQGKGYSPAFIENFQSLVDRLRAPKGDEELIEVMEFTDDVCGPCPERRGKLCTSQAKIETLDRAHAKALDLNPGDKLTWGEAKNRIQKSIDVETFHVMCKPCGWKELGFCEKALISLTDLREE